ncbi:hypothetical protein RV11_GL002336 [Enterococcus phoeniculicola]|nr:hypothetical protein RV11_GL002336 [Enterococcus phoeniculicola]
MNDFTVCQLKEMVVVILKKPCIVRNHLRFYVKKKTRMK